MADEELPVVVHATISATNQIVEMIDSLLTKSPNDSIEVPREALVGVKTLLGIHSRLVLRIFQENQEVVQQSMNHLKKVKKNRG